MKETIQADWIKSEAINLENCCNDNPFKILGPHFYKEQWVIRVWMPEADEVKITELMKEVNEARDKLKIAREERESWIVDHNESVEKMMKTGAEDPKVADSMVDQLLNQGSLTFGGTMSGDRQGVSSKRSKSKKKKSMRRVDMNVSRSRK